MAGPDDRPTLPAVERGQFIGIRKSDILDALVAGDAVRNEADREPFRQVCRLLSSIFHYEYFDWLERLRNAYYYFDPGMTPPATFDEAAQQRTYAELVTAFEAVLKGANFVEISREEIERAHRDSALVQVEIRAPQEELRDVRFFRRGHHQATAQVPAWFGLRRRPLDILVYDDVIMFAAMKPHGEVASKRVLRRLSQNHTRPGCVLIKYFRNIAAADLNALYPNARVVLSWRDSLFLAVPALAGAVPVLLNIASTVTVLFVVLGFYLGLRGAVEDNDMKTALAALSALVAFGGFVMRQWVKYQRKSLHHQKKLADTVYYRNVSNNAGMFDYLIGAAEEQETKEALLAYAFLLGAEAPLTRDGLDARVEHWLKAHFGADIDFEADDALAKLERLGLLRAATGGGLAVLAIRPALVQLDQRWDAYFRFEEPSAAGVSAP